MSKDIVAHLQMKAEAINLNWSFDHPQDRFALRKLLSEAADEITALRAKRDELREVVEWYGEQARLARLIHSGGDSGRHNLQADGGKKARAALKDAE